MSRTVQLRADNETHSRFSSSDMALPEFQASNIFPTCRISFSFRLASTSATACLEKLNFLCFSSVLFEKSSEVLMSIRSENRLLMTSLLLYLLLTVLGAVFLRLTARPALGSRCVK